MPEYYYKKLDPGEQHVYRKCRDALRAGKRKVSMWKVSPNQLTVLLKKLALDHPELFYVDFRQIETVEDQTGRMVWNIRYCCPAEKIPQTVADMERTLQKVMATADTVREKSELARCKWIHDILVRHVRYDMEAAKASPALYPEAYTIEGVFRRRRAVCEGISLAAALLGDRLGLTLPVITGVGLTEQIGFDDGHAWNLALIGGGVAHLDITWDICVSAPLGLVRYDYFCVSDKEIRADHRFSDRDLPGKTGIGCPDFFRKTGRFFTEFRQCEEYVSSQVKRKERIFYFKYLPESGTAASEEGRMERMVIRKSTPFFLRGCQLETNHNLPCGVFLYRVSGGIPARSEEADAKK